MKMERVEPSPGRFDFEAADRLVAFAEQAGALVRGHTLVWGNQLPRWVTHPLRPWTKARLLEVERRYITALVSHFRGRVAEWDVVNEATTSEGRLTSNIWLQVIGPEYIARALKWAHAADPRARLLLNDGGEAPGAKPSGILRLARGLRRGGAPLDRIGIETHTTVGIAPSEDALRKVMTAYARIGLQTEITEMDVIDRGPAPAAQAHAYQAAARACAATPSCVRFTVWGVADPWSWRGADAHALLLGPDYRPKPALDAVTGVLAIRPQG